MPADLAESERCPRCGGRGWIVEPDGGAGRARPCPCREEQLGPLRLAAAGIPQRYAHCRLANFKVASPSPREAHQLAGALSSARQYVDDFLQPGAGRGFRDSGLLFVGPAGTGKTHLAASILRELIERYRVRGRFVELTELIYQIQSTFDPRSPESKHEVLDPLTDAELLVLDELGAQQMTPWVHDVLYLVINGRYTRRLPTIFTTNYRLDPAAGPKAMASLDRGADEPRAGDARFLSERISARFISRLYEMALPVELLEVGDFRRHMKSAGARVRLG
jgi:DNA replication protein DnaC